MYIIIILNVDCVFFSILIIILKYILYFNIIYEFPILMLYLIYKAFANVHIDKQLFDSHYILLL